VERTDWLDVGFDSAQAQFLMVTAITHHRFSSALWGEDEVRKLHAELAEIASAASEMTAPEPPAPLRPRLLLPDSATRSGLAEFGFPLAGRADWALAVKTAGGGAAILGATEAQGAAT
jgi:hypothetical protein